MNENDVTAIGQTFEKIFKNIEPSAVKKSLDISDIWENTITKIYKYGPKLAGHTNVIDLKNGVLLVETDHPGWSQILQSHKDFIMKGLKMNAKDVKISTIAFKVRGMNRGLSESYEETKAREKDLYLKQMEEEEKKLEELGFKNEGKKEEIPEEVKKLFAEVINLDS